MSTRTLMMVLLGLCLAASPAMAAQVNITVWDGLGSDREDNETEPNTLTGQKWDLEGIFYDADTRSVTVVGGWDFISGYGGLTSGDLFISLGKPEIDEQYNDASLFLPGRMGYWGYDYAVAVDWDGADGNVATWQVYEGAALVDINEVTDISESNPWRVMSGSAGAVDGAFGFTTQVDVSNVSWANFAGWHADSGSDWSQNNDHYAVTFDLKWLITEDWLLNDAVDLYFHFTYECGNDMVRAELATTDMSTTVVPEPATMTLLGLGIAGMITMQMRKKSTRA